MTIFFVETKLIYATDNKKGEVRGLTSDYLMEKTPLVYCSSMHARTSLGRRRTHVKLLDRQSDKRE